MKNKLLSISKIFVPIFFWLFIWDILSLLVNNAYFLPSVSDALRALCALVVTGTFYKVVSLTVLRVLLGLFLGTVFGIIFAALSHRFKVLNMLISPLISIIKATPVATIIIILWVMLSGDFLSVFIAFLMVMPIVWQNLIDGFDSIDETLIEVATLYEFSFTKKLKTLIFPTLKQFLIPAIITSVGLAWKSEIAAEIIAYTKNSIGQQINDAKYIYDSATVFAWTLVIVLMSIILEKATRAMLTRCKK